MAKIRILEVYFLHISVLKLRYFLIWQQHYKIYNIWGHWENMFWILQLWVAKDSSSEHIWKHKKRNPFHTCTCCWPVHTAEYILGKKYTHTSSAQ